MPKQPRPTDDGTVWEDPSPASRQRVPWVDKLVPLLDHPGRWARIHSVSRPSAWTIVAQLRAGQRARPPGRWEFVARGDRDDRRRGHVYARYLGPEDGDA